VTCVSSVFAESITNFCVFSMPQGTQKSRKSVKTQVRNVDHKNEGKNHAKHIQNEAETEGKTDENSKEKHNVEGVSGKVGPPDGKWLPQGVDRCREPSDRVATHCEP